VKRKNSLSVTCCHSSAVRALPDDDDNDDYAILIY